MKLGADVIDRSAEEGARLAALGLLEEGDRAAKRLERGDGAEALHDFRVAVRRLRTTLRTFRPVLASSVGGELERRLKKLARSTNEARDAEVQLAWLASQRESLDSPARRPGIDFLVHRFELRQAEGEANRPRAVARHARISRKLASRLLVYEASVDPAGERAPFAALLASLAAEQLRALRELLGSIRDAGDEPQVHAARIQGKRLRYLLETLKGNPHADAREAVSQLKALQDVLGDLHDAHVLAQDVAAALVEAAGERARQLYQPASEGARSGGGPPTPLRPGLLAVARRLRKRRDALFAELDGAWRAGKLARLEAEIARLVVALEARAGGRLERVRTYALAGVPPAVEGVAAVEIWQGWLPGELLRERVSRTRSADGERYWRAVERGTGGARVTLEEEAGRELFEALWALTGERRVAKRRWTVQDGGLTWEIDQFLDRDLVLAEVVLPPDVAEAPAPAWLAPLLVSEVTDDPAYQAVSLAQALPREGDGGEVAEPASPP